jgi:hypothetical protein
MLQEWRGLMSLLALHKVQQYPVEFVPVPLVDGVFKSALERLAPPAVHLEKEQAYEWTDVMMIRYEGTAVGAFSPLTLVYTAADYQESLGGSNLNLAGEDGFLQPPQHREEQQQVAEWLQDLKRRLSGGEAPILDQRESNADREIVGVINELIDTWLQELREILDIDGDIDAPYVAVSSSATTPAESWPALDTYRVYDALLHPLLRDESNVGDELSDLLLQPSRNQSGLDKVVVITERLIRKDRRIWRFKRLSQLGDDAQAVLDEVFDAPIGRVIKKEDLGEFNARWIRPEKYFLTDVLVQTRHGESLLAREERALNEGGRYLLPFRKEILDFFGSRDIQRELRPRFVPDDQGVKFTFQLPVGDETISVEKYYSRKNPSTGQGHLQSVSVPAIELFPDYLDRHWRRHYVFNGHRDSVKVTPVVYGDTIVATREQTGKLSEHSARRRVEIAELTGEGAFPDGLEVHSARNDECWGLILIGLPEQEPESLAHTWTVGIDFGTSNTNVYCKIEGEAKARPWAFDFPKHLRTLTAPPPEERQELLNRFFLPDRQVPLPVPTGLRVFEDGKKKHPLLDYFVDFNSSYQPSSRVKTDMKWETEETDRETKFFLESLFILVLIEAVSQRARELRIRCSYPKAFSDTLLMIFKGEWEGVISKICEGEHRVLETLDPNTVAADRQQGKIELREAHSETEGKVGYEKEGVASGEYFASPLTIDRLEEQADTAIAAICLDVGGGTTDVSIWSRNEIVYDASVLLAGKQVSDFLRKMPRLREMLFSPAAAAALDEVKEKTPQFAARLNLILKQEEQSIRGRLVDNGTRDDIVLLRQVLALEFGAIAFYVADLLKAADQTEQGHGILDKISQNGISMHWGGNAAKLITWIDFGRYDEHGIAAFILNVAFYQALQDLDVTVDPDSLSQRQSPGHKSEASGGLVVLQERANGRSQETSTGEHEFDAMSSSAADIPSDAPNARPSSEPHAMDDKEGIVCGENITLRTGDVRHYELVSEDLLYNSGKTQFEQTSLDRLTRFAEIINFFGVRKGVFTEDMKIPVDQHAHLIRRKVKGNFNSAEREARGSRFIEPIFISEIKLLQKALIDDWRK